MALSPGQHHLHLRKRILNNREKFPSPKKKVKILDSLVYGVSILGPAMALPQVLKIFLLKDAGGISFITHLTWLFFSVVWIFYGVEHKEKPIILANILWVLFEVSTLVGVLLYSKVFF